MGGVVGCGNRAVDDDDSQEIHQTSGEHPVGRNAGSCNRVEQKPASRNTWTGSSHQMNSTSENPGPQTNSVHDQRRRDNEDTRFQSPTKSDKMSSTSGQGRYRSLPLDPPGRGNASKPPKDRDGSAASFNMSQNSSAGHWSTPREGENLRRSAGHVGDRTSEGYEDNASQRQMADHDRREVLDDTPSQPQQRKKTRKLTDHQRTGAQGRGDQDSTLGKSQRPKSAMCGTGDWGGFGGDDTQRSLSSLPSQRDKRDGGYGSTRGGRGTSGSEMHGELPGPRESWTCGQQIRADKTTTIQVDASAHSEDQFDDKETRIAKLLSVVDELKKDKEKLREKLAVAEKKAVDERQNYNGLLENRIRRDPDNQNLNDKWRVEKVLERFKALRDSTRLDFIDALELKVGRNFVGETPLLQLACEIFMVCYSASINFASCVKASLQGNLRKNLNLRDEISFSDGLMTELKFLLKEHLEEADKTEIIKRIMCGLRETVPDWDRVKNVLEEHLDGRAFLDECLLLSWAMVLQHPPLEPVCHDERFNGVRHNLYAECRKGRKSILFSVWPVVVDSVGGSVLEKGVVVTRSERKSSRKGQSSQIVPSESVETLM